MVQSGSSLGMAIDFDSHGVLDANIPYRKQAGKHQFRSNQLIIE